MPTEKLLKLIACMVTFSKSRYFSDVQQGQLPQSALLKAMIEDLKDDYLQSQSNIPDVVCRYHDKFCLFVMKVVCEYYFNKQELLDSPDLIALFRLFFLGIQGQGYQGRFFQLLNQSKISKIHKQAIHQFVTLDGDAKPSFRPQ